MPECTARAGAGNSGQTSRTRASVARPGAGDATGRRGGSRRGLGAVAWVRALGQITPGPVAQTVAVVGFAAAGVTDGLLAALVAFAPSLAFVLSGGRSFNRIRTNATALDFLSGAGPAAIDAIAGSAVPLAAAFQRL